MPRPCLTHFKNSLLSKDKTLVAVGRLKPTFSNVQTEQINNIQKSKNHYTPAFLFFSFSNRGNGLSNYINCFDGWQMLGWNIAATAQF